MLGWTYIYIFIYVPILYLYGKEVNDLAEEDKKKKIKKTRQKQSVPKQETNQEADCWFLLIWSESMWLSFLEGFALVCGCWVFRVKNIWTCGALMSSWAGSYRQVTAIFLSLRLLWKRAEAWSSNGCWCFVPVLLHKSKCGAGNDVTFSLWAQWVRKVRCKLLWVPKLRCVCCCNPNVTDNFFMKSSKSW